jgi:hypothetical protein
MTLVLSLITESWAIQVSDRRLVWLDAAGGIVRKDEERNKAVLWVQPPGVCLYRSRGAWPYAGGNR